MNKAIHRKQAKLILVNLLQNIETSIKLLSESKNMTFQEEDILFILETLRKGRPIIENLIQFPQQEKQEEKKEKQEQEERKTITPFISDRFFYEQKNLTTENGVEETNLKNVLKQRLEERIARQNQKKQLL